MRFGLIALLVVATPVGITCGSPPARPGQEWTVYAPPDGGFQLEFPGTPELSDGEVDGQPSHVAIVKMPEQKRIFLFSTFIVPREESNLSFGAITRDGIEAARASFAKQLNRPCESGEERSFQVSGRDAVEVVVKCGADARSRIRVVNALPKLFQLITSGSAGVVDDELANRFMDSLLILPHAAGGN